MTPADELRERATYLREHPEVWVGRTPQMPGEECAVYRVEAVNGPGRVGRIRPAISSDAVWVANLFSGQGGRWSIIGFNDDEANDVIDVAVQLEKAAAWWEETR